MECLCLLPEKWQTKSIKVSITLEIVVFRVILGLLGAHLTYGRFCSPDIFANSIRIKAIFSHCSLSPRNKNDSWFQLGSKKTKLNFLFSCHYFLISWWLVLRVSLKSDKSTAFSEHFLTGCFLCEILLVCNADWGKKIPSWANSSRL